MFIKNDSGFICQHCGYSVEPLGYTSRNHCPKCLYSVHLDIFPGDRENGCRGLMRPFGIEMNPKKGYVILFRCERCGEVKKNKAAEDDNYDEIVRLSVNRTDHA